MEVKVPERRCGTYQLPPAPLELSHDAANDEAKLETRKHIASSGAADTHVRLTFL